MTKRKVKIKSCKYASMESENIKKKIDQLFKQTKKDRKLARKEKIVNLFLGWWENPWRTPTLPQ